MSDDTRRRGRTTFTAAFLVVALLTFGAPPRAHALVCGDGTLDVLEDCDEGPANGAADSCCTALCAFRPANDPCRNAAGDCDVADVCSGSSGTCDDAKSTAECRPAAGVCDVAESCDGVSNDCPADDFVAASVECRASAGVCDPAEHCTGSSADCPADAKSTAACRPSAGVCDVAEACDGVGDDCPADDFEPASVECRAAAGVCDIAEFCTGSSAACPANAKSTAVCRPSAGVCDVAESCNGSSNNCPADGFAAASVECRAAAGVCDAAEHCSGSAAACPADAKSTAVCRPGAGVCDVAESCDGSGDDCPADGFAAASVECRPTAGSCDVAEHCTGSGVACPADGFVSGGIECRPDAGGCDVAEQCTGSSAACPVDAFEPDETPCDDANFCSINDRCIGGVCGGFLESCGNGVTDNGCFEECDDGNDTPGDGCDPTCHLEPCGPAPIPGCRGTTVAGKAGVLVLSRLNTAKNKLQWKYSPGDTTPKADFGDPSTTTSFQFCVYEENAGDSRLAARYAIPAGGNCATGPCWRGSSSGYKYTDKTHASDGISGLILKQGLTPGKTKIILNGKGANLPIPVLPLVQGPDVVMQLRGSNGVCWETRFASPAIRNQPDQFRDK